VTVPIASFLKAYATIAPRYDATAYAATGNSTSATSLSSELGVIIPATQALSFKVGAGMVDLWSTQAGPSADPAAQPFALTGRGIAGVEWKQETGMSASGTYALGAAASGSWTLSMDPSGAPADSHAGCKTSLALGNQDSLALAATYTGSLDGISSLTWSNAGHASLSQQLAPWLSYGLAADLSGSAGSASAPTFGQSYQGKLAFTPSIAGRTFSFALGETLALAVLASPAQVVSKAGAELQAPIFSFLSTRYRFDWEWDAQSAPGAGPDSSFHHTVGLSLSGQPLPFSLGVEYGLTHGFRGLRHDMNASLSVAVIRNLALQGSLHLSEYDAGGTPQVPFLAMLNASYQF
jgi:hypothetical protein